MTTTVRVSGISNDAWTELADGSANVTVDLDNENVFTPDILVHVGTAAPAADSDVGFKLSRNRRTFPIAGLENTDKVYARSLGTDTSVVVAKS